MKEGHARSIVKTLIWRIIATLITVLVVFVLTKKVALSLEVGGIALVVKLIFYYLHERVWNNISWGKPKHPLEDIPVRKDLSEEDKKKVEDQLKNLGYM